MLMKTFTFQSGSSLYDIILVPKHASKSSFFFVSVQCKHKFEKLLQQESHAVICSCHLQLV